MSKTQIISIVGLLVIIVLIGGIYIYSNQQTVTSSNVTGNSAGVDTATKEYKYVGDFITPNFSITYPSEFSASTSDKAAEWDLTLTKGTAEIQVDFSGEDADIDQAAKDWITVWGAKDVQYNISDFEAGTTNFNTPYKLFQVTESGKSPYMLLVSKIGPSYQSTGYLAIKGTQDNLPEIKEIVSSLKALN